MSNGKENNIRNLRNGQWYWISRAVLKRYGRILKSSGLAVYNALASYSNSKSQTCFPTQKAIADRIGLCRETVNRKVALLKTIGLIRVKRLRGRCLYFLLKPNVILNHTRCDGQITRDVILCHTNNNKEIKINNKNKGRDGFNNLSLSKSDGIMIDNTNREGLQPSKEDISKKGGVARWTNSKSRSSSVLRYQKTI